MGSTCGKPKNSSSESSETIGLNENPSGRFGTHNSPTKQSPDSIPELNFPQTDERKTQLEEWLRLVQAHSRERLRKEIITDLHGFILNNLLLSVQFFENFETSMTESKKFKEDKETEMTGSIEQISNEGMILGARKCELLHGMSHVISQNLIYRDNGHEYHKRKQDSPSTSNQPHPISDEPGYEYMPDNILPLEYFISWNNLKVHKESEWDDIHRDPRPLDVRRFCMEESDDRIPIPKGYVRLLVVDLPDPIQPGFEKQVILESTSPTPPGSINYPINSGHLNYSSADRNDILSEDETLTSFTTGKALLKNLKIHLDSQSHVSKIINQFGNQKSITTELNQTKPARIVARRRQLSEGEIPEKYENDNSLLPCINVLPSTPITSSANDVVTSGVHEDIEPQNKQIPRAYSQNLTIEKKCERRLSLPNITLREPQLITSGYESMIASPLKPRSRSSSASVASDEIHYKWRQIELKRLSQYIPKMRSGTTEPLSPSCYHTIQIEIDTDEINMFERDSRHSSSSSSDSESSIHESENELNPTSKHNRQRLLSEPEYIDQTYLNSVGFSADFCSEFKQVGSEIGIDNGALRDALVLGTTIRTIITKSPPSRIPQPSTSTAQPECCTRISKHVEPIRELITFTPSLHSESWPQLPLIWWKERMLRGTLDGIDRWPAREQVEYIEDQGCNLIPLGSRSINSTQSENVQQSLIWSVGFCTTETILLDSLQHVQWRCLAFSSLVFRAFLAPLGPLGIEVEHFRNIIYFMCHEDFLDWNYEQPAVHLKTLIDKLYDCLGRGDLPSFFIRGHNLLKNIPIQNLRKVQANLARLRNNLLCYSLFMIQNVIPINSNFYPWPKDNFRKLYDYLTISEKEILYLVNPLLAGKTTADINLKSKNKRKKLNYQYLLNGESPEDEENVRASTPFPRYRPIDHEKRKLQRKRERWVEKQRQQKEFENERARMKSESVKLPQDRRKSIDVNAQPLKQTDFSAQRLGLVLKYFIKHFIKMAAKSYEFRAWSQAAMYTIHVENLISLLCELPNETGSNETEKFKEDIKIIHETIGIRMLAYIDESISLNDENVSENETNLDASTGLIISRTIERIDSTNWDMKKLPRLMVVDSAKLYSHQTTPLETLVNMKSLNFASLATMHTDDESPSFSDFHIPRIAKATFRKNTGFKWRSTPATISTPPKDTILKE